MIPLEKLLEISGSYLEIERRLIKAPFSEFPLLLGRHKT
jgi:hypothetical protein